MKGFETERKFVIKKPSEELLSSHPGFTVSYITQTYLLSDLGVTHRVRRRVFSEIAVYTECKKQRISATTCIEDEREIDSFEYEELLNLRDPGARTIEKKRITFRYGKQLFEVDVYPEWQNSCIMEVELPSEDESVDFPPFITVIKEVTGDKRYSNAGMARAFPEEIAEA